MQMLRITQCRDPQMWYASLVGELVPYCGRWREAYKSLEPAGYINRVEFDDAEIVKLSDSTVTPNVEHDRRTAASSPGVRVDGPVGPHAKE